VEKMFEEVIKKIKKFNHDRDWDKYHNPKDLILALVSEVGELADHYRWASDDEILEINKKDEIAQELADIFSYLIILSYKIDVNLLDEVEKKLEKNNLRYPIDKMKGVHSNKHTGFKNP
jgi:dCTP diphosphatase